jgi:hypothetical protein
MNSEVFNTYVPAINAYLNAKADPSLKTWGGVATLFFRMNMDENIASVADLADAFAEAKHPTYPRICVKDIKGCFNQAITPKILIKNNLVKGEDFVVSSGDVRITFQTLRQLVFTMGDRELIEAYGFIDKVYQMYARYAVAMSSRSRNPTHWTIIERIGAFTQAMQPHIDFAAIKASENGNEPKPKFLTMDRAPKVYSIYKGTLKTLEARIQKNVDEHAAFDALKPAARKAAEKRALQKKDSKAASKTTKDVAIPKHAAVTTIPIYETVMSNIDDEIAAITSYLEEHIIKPYRTAQLENGVTSISLTKYNVKTTKSFILVDPEYESFSAKHLADCVHHVRSEIQMGELATANSFVIPKLAREKISKSKKTTLEPFIDIELFASSNGERIDQDKRIPINPHDADMTTLINRFGLGNEQPDLLEEKKPSRLAFAKPAPNKSEDYTDGEEEEEDEEEEDEEDAEDMDLDSDE